MRYSGAIGRKELETFLPVACAAIEAAAESIRRAFAQGRAYRLKDDGSRVTQADEQAELVLRQHLERAFPGHRIVGEEFGSKPGDESASPYTWVLDPIDGTDAFTSNAYLFGTLVALLREGRPILGLLCHPLTRHLLVGTADGTTLDGLPVRVRRGLALNQATLLVSSPDAFVRARPRHASRYRALTRSMALYRGWGDCHGYFQVATGGAHVMLDAGLSDVDVPALVPIIEGAGGRITSWCGGDPVGAGQVLATNGELHDEVLERLQLGKRPPAT